MPKLRTAVAALFSAAVGCSLVLAVSAFAAPGDPGDDTVYPTQNTYWDCHASSVYETMYCQTDNTNVTAFRQNSLGADGKAAIAWTLNNLGADTDLDTTLVTDPVYDGVGATDIIYQQGTLGLSANALGVTSA